MNPCNILSEERYVYLNLSVKLDACALSTGHFFFGRRGPGTFEEGPPTQKQCVAAR